MKNNDLLQCLIEQVGGEKQAYAVYVKSRLAGLKKNATLDEVVKFADKVGLGAYLKKLPLTEVAALIAGEKVVGTAGKRGRPAKAGKAKSEKVEKKTTGKKKTRVRLSKEQLSAYEGSILTFLTKKSDVALSAVCQGIGLSNKTTVRKLLNKLLKEKKIKAAGERASRKYALGK